MLYLYAITDPRSRLPAIAGLRGAEVRPVPIGGLSAAVSEHESIEVATDEDDLWAHEQVVEGLMADGPVLPMRLGSVLPDEASVLAAVGAREAELVETLARIEGAVELGVRAAIDPAAMEPEESDDARQELGPGAEYMHARLTRERRADEVAETIHRPLAELARESARRRHFGEDLVFNGAYLVDVGAVDRFRAEVEELDAAIGAASIVCTGPWPAYTFSSRREES